MKASEDAYEVSLKTLGWMALIVMFVANLFFALLLASDHQSLVQRAKDADARQRDLDAKTKSLDRKSEPFDVRASKLDKHERELRELAWGLAERKQDLDRRDAAVSNQVRLLKRRDDVLALIRKSADRIHEAVKEREKRLVRS